MERELGQATDPSSGRRRRQLAVSIVARLLAGLVSVWGVSTIVFLVTRLTGDPVRLMSPPGAPPSQLQATARFFGLDQPVPVQYARFLAGLTHLDLGESYYWRQPTAEVVFTHLPATLELAALSFGVTLGLALPAALAAAHREGGLLDRALTAVAGVGVAIPQFWLGPLLIIAFAVSLHALPASGRGGIRSYVLPVATLAAVQVSILFVLARSALARELRAPYADLARAKGAGSARLMLVHVLPNAGLQVLTLAGLILANLIAGDVIVEAVFAWPGIGQLFISSVGELDFPVIQAITLVYSVAFIGILIVVDALYRLIDPRTESEA
jgi:peptide/nickel transport system permease protein